MKQQHSYKVGDLVNHPSDSAPFVVKSVRADAIEIYGDWSGGSHAMGHGRDWVSPDKVTPINKERYYVNVVICGLDKEALRVQSLIEECDNVSRKNRLERTRAAIMDAISEAKKYIDIQEAQERD